MNIAKIALVVVVFAGAGAKFGRDYDNRPGPYSRPGMINVDAAVAREIDEATGKVEELMSVYQQMRSEARSEEEIEDADEFYDRMVIPAEIVRLKMVSRKHSFRYDGLPTPSRINRMGADA